jgi:hypothetical protein
MTDHPNRSADIVERLRVIHFFSDSVMAARMLGDELAIDIMRAERKEAADMIESLRRIVFHKKKTDHIPDVAQPAALPGDWDRLSFELAGDIQHSGMGREEAAGRIRAFACDTMLAALASQPQPAATVEAPAPGHTDLMVTPESIDAFLEANPPPHECSSAGSEQLETYDAWLAPETFHSLPMRERVHYTVKMLGSVNLTKEACDRQARRITDALEAAGLIPSEPQGAGK